MCNLTGRSSHSTLSLSLSLSLVLHSQLNTHISSAHGLVPTFLRMHVVDVVFSPRHGPDAGPPASQPAWAHWSVHACNNNGRFIGRRTECVRRVRQRTVSPHTARGHSSSSSSGHARACAPAARQWMYVHSRRARALASGVMVMQCALTSMRARASQTRCM